MQRNLVKIIAVFIFLVSIAFKPGVLTRRTILNDKVQLLLPEDFVPMDKSTLDIKYPRAGNRPTLVYTNKNASVNIAFNLTAQPLDQTQLPQLQKQLTTQISSIPGSQLLKNEIKELNGSKVTLIEFMSQAINSKIYNIMFVTVVGGKAMIGSFNCTEKEVPEWKPVSKQIVESIKLL
ncbi:MAG TPA: hypothetical protein VKB19_04285 [Pedobacter sp.]|nr:hypothetical protein [Pedobacter sp.]